MSPAPRLTVSFALSVLVHLVALAMFLRSVPPVTRTAIPVPVALVGRFGGGGGGNSGAAPPAAVEEPVAPPAPTAAPARRKPKPSGSVVARVSRPTEPVPPPAAGGAGEAAVPGGTPGGEGGGGGGSGQGDGSGGDGSGGARVAYGANPLPPYPMVARRLGKEGVVLLDVLVAADGSPAEVHVARTSGFAPLDESAVATVRSRWRFLPAQRDGVPYASRVTIPIRFRLDRAGEG